MRQRLEALKVEIELPDGNKIRFRPFAEGDAEVIKDVYEHRHYDALHIEKGMCVFDIGAHIGAFTLKAAKAVGSEGIVVAVEPESRNFALLKENVDLNRYENVIVVRKAIANFKGKTPLYIGGSTLPHSIVFKRPEYEIVDATTFDDLVREVSISPDIVKIDAEGASLKILENAEKLKECKRIAVAAYHFAGEDIRVSLKLNEIGFKTETIFVRGSVYRDPFSLYIPVVLGKRERE